MIKRIDANKGNAKGIDTVAKTATTVNTRKKSPKVNALLVCDGQRNTSRSIMMFRSSATKATQVWDITRNRRRPLRYVGCFLRNNNELDDCVVDGSCTLT